MKSINLSKFIQFRGLGVAMTAFSAIILSQTAFGHHDTQSLELYPRDASDACIADSLKIRVTVNNVSHVGLMKLELYAEEDGFLEKKGRLRRVRVEALDGPQLICINVPTAGEYAIAGYHDIDGNRKLKKKWDFTPKEPYGLSNNPEIRKRRVPKFEESVFDVFENGADITINLVDLGKKKDKNDDE